MRALNGEQDSRGSDWCMINGWYALFTNLCVCYRCVCVCVALFQNQLLTRGLSEVLDQVQVHSGETLFKNYPLN